MSKETDINLKTTKSEWIDISWPLRQGMTIWHNDNPPAEIAKYDPPVFEIVKHPDKDAPVTMWALKMLVHTGTHIDTPRHFVPDGATIDDMPLDAIIGPARVIEIKDPVSIKPEELEPYDIQPGERIFFKTQNSSKCYKKDGFIRDYVYISTEAAYFLYEKKISVVGIDYIAIGSYHDKKNLIEVHEVLVGNGIWAVEGLNLSGVRPGPCEVICLPIRLENGDSSPARAIMRPV